MIVIINNPDLQTTKFIFERQARMILPYALMDMYEFNHGSEFICEAASAAIRTKGDKIDIRCMYVEDRPRTTLKFDTSVFTNRIYPPKGFDCVFGYCVGKTKLENQEYKDKIFIFSLPYFTSEYLDMMRAIYRSDPNFHQDISNIDEVTSFGFAFANQVNFMDSIDKICSLCAGNDQQLDKLASIQQEIPRKLIIRYDDMHLESAAIQEKAKLRAEVILSQQSKMFNKHLDIKVKPVTQSKLFRTKSLSSIDRIQ